MGMLKPKVKLTRHAIFAHPINKNDKIMTQRQLYWIVEAIIYALLEVKKLDLLSNLWLNMFMVDHLST